MKLGALAPLVTTPERRAVLIALSSAYMLVQLSSLPVALSLPTLARHFDRGVDDAAWMVVIYLLTLGAFVMLGARLGDRYGHARVFFIGLVLSTLGSILIAVSSSLLQVIIWRGLTGIGSALIMGKRQRHPRSRIPARRARQGILRPHRGRALRNAYRSRDIRAVPSIPQLAACIPDFRADGHHRHRSFQADAPHAKGRAAHKHCSG